MVSSSSSPPYAVGTLENPNKSNLKFTSPSSATSPGDVTSSGLRRGPPPPTASAPFLPLSISSSPPPSSSIASSLSTPLPSFSNPSTSSVPLSSSLPPPPLLSTISPISGQNQSIPDSITTTSPRSPLSLPPQPSLLQTADGSQQRTAGLTGMGTSSLKSSSTQGTPLASAAITSTTPATRHPVTTGPGTGTNMGGNGNGGGCTTSTVAFKQPNSRSQFKVRWSKIKRKIGTSSLHWSLDGSGGELTMTDTSESDINSYDGGGGGGGRSGKGNGGKRKSSDDNKNNDFSKGGGGGTSKNSRGSCSSTGGRSGGRRSSHNGSVGESKTDNSDEKLDGVLAEQEVDEVVVDNTALPEFWVKSSSGVGGAGANKEGTNTHNQSGAGGGDGGSSGASLKHTHRGTMATGNDMLDSCVGFIRWRLWPVAANFLNPKYHDPKTEQAYQKELWYTQKTTHIIGTLYLVLNWILLCSTLPRPWSTFNEVTNYAIIPAISLPLIPYAFFNFPSTKPWFWQISLFVATFFPTIMTPIDMYMCGYYTAQKHCGNRDFLGMMYYAAALPVIALFALGQKRGFVIVGCACWFVFTAATILVHRKSFIRNMLNIVLFESFVVIAHYWREMAERRMYTLRAELKVQFRAKQRAQISERKAMDSKRRFSSYIFHEVRVPLNTALLAVQNLEGSEVFHRLSDLAVEYSALESSLQMMCQVLNDVLDFSRMERGGFTSVSRPFSLHSVMRSIFGPLRLEANARQLTLETGLDIRIDRMAVSTAYPSGETVDPTFSSVIEGDGLVMGDEMRLRQVINNLASNACKFTPAGGKVCITTSLIYPDPEEEKDKEGDAELGAGGEKGAVEVENGCISNDSSPKQEGAAAAEAGNLYSPRLSAGRLQQHEAKTTPKVPPTDKKVMVVRFEITDTGVGIRRGDMAENRLFSAYVQTEIGRKQGGKGTGLGLSLVRQIVLLSGGRLGVKSSVGQGSTFWVELPFSCGPQTREKESSPHRRISLTTSDGKDGGTSSSAGQGSAYSISTAYEKELASGAVFYAPVLSSLPVLPPTSASRQSSERSLQKIDESSAGNNMEMTDTGLEHADHPPPAPPQGDGGNGECSNNAHDPRRNRPLGDTSLHSGQMQVRPETHTSLSAPAKVTTLQSLSKRTPGAASEPMHFADGPLRVLVVDDDRLTRTLMERMMVRLGQTVSTAENGAIALDLLLKTTPEVALAAKEGIDPRAGPYAPKNFEITFLDNQMPILSGLQVVDRLRSLGRNDLVIGVTANALIHDQEEYVERGASYVLTKPVLETDLRRFLAVADKRRSEAKHLTALAEM